MIYFKDWLWNKLPYYFIKNDSYKDFNGEGLLRRYLRIFGMELDENIKPFIDNFMDLFDVMKCNKDLLPQLSFILGLPPNINNTEVTYRKMLAYAVAIYKIKGTAKSYKALFNLIGLRIQIVEDEPNTVATYDESPVLKHDDNPIPIYDIPSYCSTYSIYYNTKDNNPVDPALLTLAQNIIGFMEPINAKLLGMVRRLELDEDYLLGVGEETSLPPYTPPIGSYSDDFDNVNSYN